ncbi:hypothetical protein ACVWZ8_003148 [Arthrobacter sp. UYCu723]
MLVPPSLDEWLPQKNLARFIAEVVAEELDPARFYGSYAKAKGQPPCDPRLIVRVLLHGCCVGVRSSRELERGCEEVVAFRWLAGQQVPVFRSIGRFRQRHLVLPRTLFDAVGVIVGADAHRQGDVCCPAHVGRPRRHVDALKSRVNRSDARRQRSAGADCAPHMAWASQEPLAARSQR